MELYQIVYFIWFAVVKGDNSPALVLYDPQNNFDFSLATLEVSDNGERFFSPKRDNCFYLACPPSSEMEEKINMKSKSGRVLIVKDERNDVSMTTIMSYCHSPIKAAIVYDDYFVRNPKFRIPLDALVIPYKIGFELYKPSENEEAIEEKFPFLEFIDVEVYEHTKDVAIISYTISLGEKEYFPLQSSSENDDVKKIDYDNTKEILNFKWDDRYAHFLKKWPKMEIEKSLNREAHAEGVEKMQLVSRDDFPVSTWMAVTYFDILTAPVWKILTLTWKKAEIFIRRLSKVVRHLTIHVGASRVLKSSYSQYTSENQLILPKYVWKIVQLPYSPVIMLIIMHNDPFTKDQKRICENICSRLGWNIVNDDYRLGLLYCCEFTLEVSVELGISYVYRKHKFRSEEFSVFDLNASYDGLPSDLLGKMSEIEY